MEKLTDCRTLRNLGILVSILLLWNGVCDYIYGYTPALSGTEYFSPAVWDVISTANGRPHWMVMMAQTAGWLYPVYALSYLPWWVGMRKAGFWWAAVPNLLLAYALLMIGGIQHAGWAFLSVLGQAKAAVGSTDALFFDTAQTYIVEHFVMGDLTALIAFYVGMVWHAVSILSGKTPFPRRFVLFSPFSVLIVTMVIGGFSPAPLAGIFIALFGTWFMLVPLVAVTVWMGKNECGESSRKGSA